MSVREELTSTRAVVIAFFLLTIAPFARAAATSWFWEPQHRMAPVATGLFLVLVLALVVGRYRWAWIVVALFEASALIGWLVDPTSVRPANIPLLVASVCSFGLLLSSPMRRRLRAPVRLPGRGVARA